MDDLIARLGEYDQTLGEKITWDLIVRSSTLILGWPVSLTAAKRHRSRHTRRVGDVAPGAPGGAATDGADGEEGLPPEFEVLLAEVDALLEGEQVSAEGVLGVQLRWFLAEQRRRIARGEAPQVSMEQAARAADRLIAAERQHGEASLLTALSGAVGQVFQKALSDPAPAGELVPGIVIVDERDEADVEEAEFEEVAVDA